MASASESVNLGETRHIPCGVLGREEIAGNVSGSGIIRNGAAGMVQGCSYDMRIGTIFKGRDRIKPDSPHSDKFVQIQPGEIVTLLTLEELHLPDDVLATAFAINALSSRGLLVLNPGHVDPGFIGPLTVTALNLNKCPMNVELGQPILTVIFERLPKATDSYPRNRPRIDVERELGQHIQTTGSKNVADLIVANAESPFISQADLERGIGEVRAESKERLNTTVTYTGLGIAIFGVVVAVAALVVAVMGLHNSGSSAQQASSPPVVQVFNGLAPISGQSVGTDVVSASNSGSPKTSQTNQKAPRPPSGP